MSSLQVKPCSVILEPITPKAQTCLSAELHNAIQEKSLLTVRSKRKLLTDLKELQEEYHENERSSRKGKAVAELLASESSYVHQLQVIEEYFMKPIRERGILSTVDYETLFGCIQTIKRLNEDILEKLKKLPNNIASVFIEIAPYLKVYSTYAYYYKRSINILLNANSHREEFFKFLDLQERRPEVQQKLSSLLIAPIQRIPRYCLLLQQILDNTSTSDPDYLPLTESLEKIQAIVEYIDSLVGHQEDAERLIELQHSMKNGFPCIIKPDRRLVKEGVLRKLSTRTDRLHKKYFILTTDIIIYCDILKNNINNANSLKCKGIFPLNKCELDVLSNGTFKIMCRDSEVIIKPKDVNEFREWFNAIKDTIKMYIEHKRTLRKDSSSRRPVFGKLLAEYQECGVSPGVPRRKRPLDFDRGDSKYLPTKISKRKCIKDAENVIEVNSYVPKINLPENSKIRGRDSLYPLRRKFAVKNVTFAEDSNDIKNTPAEDNAVYVFGSNTQDKGFRFKLGSMFLGLRKSLKKLFGFQDN